MKTARYIGTIIAVLLVTGLFSVTEAQHPFRRTEEQMKELLKRIETGADRFRKSLDSALDSSRIDGTKREDNINSFIKDFEQATSRLKDRYDDDQTASSTVEEVLRRATFIDDFTRRHSLTPEAQIDWQRLRRDLSDLATAYNVTWSWAGLSNRPFRASDEQVKLLFARMEEASDRFEKSFDDALDKTAFNSSEFEDEINEMADGFEDAADKLKERFDDEDSAISSVREALNYATRIDAFMRQHRLTWRAQEDWQILRDRLDLLAEAYGVSWRWY